MIEAITPLALQIVAQAGGRLTPAALIERIRNTLTETCIRHHLRDLVATGHLQIEQIENSPHSVITLGANTQPPTVTNPYFGNGEACRQLAGDRAAKPRRPPTMWDDENPVHQAMVGASKRKGRRARSAPIRTAILDLLERKPSTTIQVAEEMDLTRYQALDHITLLRRDGLVLRYDTTYADARTPVPIWVGTQLRTRLPPPEPQPPRESYYRRKQQALGRDVRTNASTTTGAPTP